MLVSHESPMCLLQESLQYNDYDYALVHLFESNVEYYNFFKQSIKMKRRVLLDNSLFELKESFNPARFSYWIKQLNPTEYIIPDALNDMNGTIKLCEDWMNLYNPNGIKIGVVHGKNIEQMVQCYKYMDSNVDKIAINFVDNFYYEYGNGSSEFNKRMNGRIKFVKYLANNRIINEHKPHHILGCVLPQEFREYVGYEWIETIDTSNPIVHAICGIKYSENGLESKEYIKLVDLMNTKKQDIDMSLVNFNIHSFKKIIGR